MNPFLATDGYKTGHHKMYPEGTTLVYSNFTPRSNKHAPKGCDKVVSFGQQMIMRQIKEMFDENFFLLGETTIARKDNETDILEHFRNMICQEIKKEYSVYLGTDYDVSHIEALWDLGFLPVEVKSLPEGTEVPMGVPVLTIWNTDPDFYWLPNFLETIISNLLWKPMTSATIARQYKKNLTSWARKTDENSLGFVEFQGHDFSMRGLDSINATISSGLGHATSFLGSDSLPVIYGARKYYDEEGAVVHSVNATEHSVMCAGTKGDEIGTFRYLMKQFPIGILSIVSDTWDLWKVLTEYLPNLKEEILARDGKIVIRPDSGDPVEIICGEGREFNTFLQEGLKDGMKLSKFGKALNTAIYHDNKGNSFKLIEINGTEDCKAVQLEVEPKRKGVIELLWDIFGGTINDQGYKVLDPHIGAIYGDSITIDRAEEICKRLEAKGFASTNIVLGVGSFTYQYNTRDTFGFAMKATYVELEMNGYPEGRSAEALEPSQWTEGRPIFKDPITDDGTKKSAKGLLNVDNPNGEYVLNDQQDWKGEEIGCLQTIFREGYFFNKITLTQIRQKLNEIN